MSTQFLKDLGIGFIFVLTEILFFQHLSIFGTTADPIIFYLLWLIAKYDRIQLLFMAALLGLFQDAFFDLWGLNMFSKTLLIFLIFNFSKRRSENQLLLWQIFLVILIAADIHNIIFWGLSSFFDAFASQYSPLLMIFGGSLYTALIGAIVYVFKDS
jgi:rod shape-determining protein MreD